MKILLTSLFLMLSGCSMKGLNATLYLKEDGSRLYNFQGDDCLESGYQTIKAPDGEFYKLIYYYSNCDVRKERQLKEIELPDWGIKKEPKFKPGTR